MNKRLSEFPDRREWNLSEFTLDLLSFGYAITLAMGIPDSSLTIVIETPFTLQKGSLVEPMNPESIVSMSRMLPLLHQSVASLTAFRSGLLLVQFEDGAEIKVPKHEQYEAWQTYGTGEMVDVGMLCSGHKGSPWGT